MKIFQCLINSLPSLPLLIESGAFGIGAGTPEAFKI